MNNNFLFLGTAAAIVLQCFLWTPDLEAFRIRIGAPDEHHRGSHWYWGDRDHWDHDDRHWDRDDRGNNFVFRGSSRIEEVSEEERDDDERTILRLRNGMVFRINGTALPIDEGDRANVFRQRTSDGPRYRLVINKYEYKVRRLD